MIVKSTSDAMDLSTALELRLDMSANEAEASKAAQTHDPVVMVPWPLDPLKTTYFYLSSPWLGAIGGLLSDAVSGASWELVARETDLAGKTIQRDASWRKEQDDDYSQSSSWLSREDIGGDGGSLLDLAGLLKAMSGAHDQNGNIFAEIVRDRAATMPVRIQHLLPQYVYYRAVERGDGLKKLELYQMDPFRGEFSYVPFGARKRGDTAAREYLHQRAPNTVSSYYGVPYWYPSKESVEVDNDHRKYLKGFFRNHGTPRYMIEITQDSSWQGAEPTQDKIDAVYRYVSNFLGANAGDMAGRNLIIQYPGGITVKATALDHKMEDPTFPHTSKNMRDEIMAVRHISLSNLGSPEGTNRATAEEHSDNFRHDVLQPFAAPAVAIINTILHAPEPHGLGIETYDFKLNFERVGDTLKRIQSVVAAVGGPVLTPPEGRQILGYEKKGPDVLYMPVNMIPSLEFGEDGPDAE